MTELFTGLSTGALYGLVALIFSIGMTQTGVFDFAAPQALMVGSFIAYMSVTNTGFPLWLAGALSVLAGATLGVFVEALAVRPLGANRHGALVTTVGAAFVIQGIAFVIWGPDAHSVRVDWAAKVHDVWGGKIQTIDFVMLAMLLVTVVVLMVVSERTPWGLAGRASMIDRDLAASRGVNVLANRVITFAAAGALAGGVGFLAGMKVYTSFDLGTTILVFSFAALTLGGIGSFPGAAVGGLIIGITQSYTARYLGDSYGLIAVFTLLLLVLLVRPAGIMGKKGLRLV